MNSARKIYIGLALFASLNSRAQSLLNYLFFLGEKVLRIEVHLAVCGPSGLQLSFDNVERIEDAPELFDFSRYQKILNSLHLGNNDIVFLCNDTLGNGRKLNFGLRLFITLGLFGLFFLPQWRRLFAPVDENSNRIWVCPYFLLGNAEFLQSLEFADWKNAMKCVSKNDRTQLWAWLSKPDGWRQARRATSRQKIIKYKTLLLERCLVSEQVIRAAVFGFRKYSFFRILNSLGSRQ